MKDFPTHVGMARDYPPLPPQPFRFPHPRGDGPVTGYVVGHRIADFPTHVGMARHAVSLPEFAMRFPHPRGDGPLLRML